jgi:hypothetical protein
MANLEFKSDLILGNEGEETVITFLKSKGCSFIDSNHDNKYDIKMFTNGKETTYEIKTDVTCAPLFDIGNIFIEFSSRNKPSGIMVTKADWFVTYFKYLNEIWFIKSDNLLKLINNHHFPVFKNAGDIGSETHGYLIKRKEFKKYFYVNKI